jgi:CRP-like cAMP-binding protein
MDNPQINIAEQITSGFISIDSLDEFEKLLKRFPGDPELQKVYADSLVKENLIEEAALSYGKAAALFLKSGKLLPAIVSKVDAWRIKSPSFQEAQLFLSALREESLPETALKIFLEKLSNPEVLSVVKGFENIHLPTQKLIQKFGDVQDSLCFIVSGSIKQTSYQPVKTKKETVFKKSIVNLSAEDSIGDLFPIKVKKICQSYVETTTAAELVKLSRQMLIQICEKYPNVELALQALGVFQSESRRENLLKKNRKSQRHQLVRKMTLEIFPHSSANFPIILEAYSKDISIGGTCVVLDEKDVSVAKSITSFSKTIKDSKVKISFPSQGLELKVSGKIAWTQEVSFQGGKTLALGIQFQDLSPKLRGMLFVFADNSNNK